MVRDYALEPLSDPDAVLVVDETRFLKQGKSSCGVGRHYTGSAGKVTNCQIGVLASYASRPSGRFAACPSGGSLRDGHAFIDRALYLPRPGRTTLGDWQQPTCRPRLPLPPSRAWRCR